MSRFLSPGPTLLNPEETVSAVLRPICDYSRGRSFVQGPYLQCLNYPVKVTFKQLKALFVKVAMSRFFL
jgi:hypothetical protein